MANTTGDILSPPAAGPVWPRADRTRVLTRLTVACIGSSILIMIAASVVRSDWMYPPVVMPAMGPPWVVQSVHVSAAVATTALWVATLLGAAGLAAGLAAVLPRASVRIRGVLLAAGTAAAPVTR